MQAVFVPVIQRRDPRDYILQYTGQPLKDSPFMILLFCDPKLRLLLAGHPVPGFPGRQHRPQTRLIMGRNQVHQRIVHRPRVVQLLGSQEIYQLIRIFLPL